MSTGFQGGSRFRPGSICFVANELNYINRNGGIGTYIWNCAILLARHGWRVHILYVRDVEDANAVAHARVLLEAHGVGLSLLSDYPTPPHVGLKSFGSCWHTERSEAVYHALKQLHAACHFDLVEFPEWWGTGFRAVQAKRAGRAFADTKLMVKTHSSTQWLREGNGQWMAHVDEVRIDFAERYAFENCDVQLSPCRYMFDYVRGIGWDVRDTDAMVIGYPLEASLLPHGPAPFESSGEIREVIFFGRLETRKGIDIFLDAAAALPPELLITFLGRETAIDGRPAGQLVAERMHGRNYQVINTLNQDEAVRYLSQPGRLAVVPSLVENFPHTVLECVTTGVPFIASSVGGIPEIVVDPVARLNLQFPPTAAGLKKCLEKYLAAPVEQRRDWHRRARGSADVEAVNRRIVSQYYSLLPAEPPAPPEPTRLPRVTVGVAYYNMGDYLPETLASLAKQTHPDLEVFVVDDGSTCPQSREVFARMERRYPQFRFLRQANGGCGAARNLALAQASGEYFIPVDADNIARPDMIESFAKALALRPDVAAFTCYSLAFQDLNAIHGNRFDWVYTPAGGPYSMACLENVLGDTNGMFRTEVLRSVGNYETDRATSWQDWMTYLKLINAGHKVEVIPECLFYYRVHGHSMTATMCRSNYDQYRMNQQLLRKSFFGDPAPVRPVEKAHLWMTLISFAHQGTAIYRQYNDRIQHLEWELRQARCELDAQAQRMRAARYRLVDSINRQLEKVPQVRAGVRGGLRWAAKVLRKLRFMTQATR